MTEASKHTCNVVEQWLEHIYSRHVWEARGEMSEMVRWPTDCVRWRRQLAPYIMYQVPIDRRSTRRKDVTGTHIYSLDICGTLEGSGDVVMEALPP